MNKTSVLISENVGVCSNHHAYSSGNNGVVQELRAEFSDSAHWDELAEKLLPAFNLPDWEVPCTTDQMTLWLERLDLTETKYKKHTNTTLNEFIELNPAWPLRAFIGTILELCAE